MSNLEIALFPCLSDNYGILIHDKISGRTATIDTPDSEEIARQCVARGWALTDIWNTHHHWDHTGGNLALKEQFGLTITGPDMIEGRIPGLDKGVGENDVLMFGSHKVHVWHTPGHTTDHIIYYVPDAGAVFVGDTLFVMGCGRLFEGSPEDMFMSMAKLAALPPETNVYCAHEYTLSNGAFAITAEPENADLKHAIEAAKARRAADQPTVPTTIGAELATNPFMRAQTAQRLGEIRQAKDNF
jgi:hydroxyacylglutathione hydrolase